MKARPLSGLAIFLSLLFVAGSTHAQSGPNYARAEQFLSWNIENHVFQHEVDVHWLEDGDSFWYRVFTPRGNEFFLMDPVRDKKRHVFDNVRLAAAMSIATDSIWAPHKLDFTTFEFGPTRDQIEFRTKKRIFNCDVSAYSCTVEPVPEDERVAVTSPDGLWEAFIDGYNLFIRPTERGEAADLARTGDVVYSNGRSDSVLQTTHQEEWSEHERGDSIQLTTDGEELYAYGLGFQRPSVVRGDYPPKRPALDWSPDSRKIAIARMDDRELETMPLYSSTSVRPTYYLYPYSLPGDSLVHRTEIHIVDIQSRNKVRVDVDPIPSINDVGYVRDSTWVSVKWTDDSNELFFIDASRGATRLSLMVADATTGRARRIVSDSGYATTMDIDWASGIPAWRKASLGDDIIWFSQRDGWGHLYRFDGQGRIRNRITSGGWSMRAFEGMDPRTGRLFFVARGREGDRLLYDNTLYRVNRDGSDLTVLTPEPADHDVDLSPSGRFFVDTYSRHDLPPTTVLRSAADGKVICELERADVSHLEAIGYHPPEPFRTVAADGITEIFGILWKPSDFDSTKVYPVIDYIYPVPGGNIRSWGYILPETMQQSALAELGFVVVQVMARGTGSRSKAFQDTYQHQMGQNTVADHVAAIKDLAARHRWIDVHRAGIYGLSGGGFASTAAILRYPDFFKAAVSINGNHDNRSYGSFWGEKYQGLLVEDSVTGKDSYEAEANYTLAASLKGKLLLMVGDMDDNVHPAHTLRLVHALIAANKKFDFMLFPDRNHSLGGPEPYALRMLFDHFVKHLLEVDPPEYTFSDPDP